MLSNEIFYEYDIREHDLFKGLKTYFETNIYPNWPFVDESGIMDNIRICAYEHKRESFKSEYEFRSATFCKTLFPDNSEVIEKDGRKILKVNFEKLCSKHNIDFEDIFKEIVIGSKSKYSKKACVSFLEGEGLYKLANKVILSKCSLI